MIEIDGSFGEGGGQIIRTAISLAAITEKEVKITNIRANRPNPGLASQHLNAVKAVERLSGGMVEGLKRGSSALIFSPGRLKGFLPEDEPEIDIGTAGSITLLLQCLIPVALFIGDKETKISIKGGTDVKWAPPIDFYTYVFAKAIYEMGCDVEIELKKRGYYPKGGGLVEVKIDALHSSHRLKGIILRKSEREEEGIIEGVSHCSSLPTHVVERQAKSAERILKEKG